MIKRLFWDERGDLSFFTIFVILSINMVIELLTVKRTEKKYKIFPASS